jgi:hypothetical protein
MSKASNAAFDRAMKVAAIPSTTIEKMVPGFVAAIDAKDWGVYEKFVCPADEKAKRGSRLIIYVDGSYVQGTVTSKTDNPFTGEPDIRVKVGPFTFKPSGCYSYTLVA